MHPGSRAPSRPNDFLNNVDAGQPGPTVGQTTRRPAAAEALRSTPSIQPKVCSSAKIQKAKVRRSSLPRRKRVCASSPGTTRAQSPVGHNAAAKLVERSKSIVEVMRPRQWADVVGHAKAVQSLKAWAANPNRSSTLVLLGPSGVGKTSLARIALAAAGFNPVEVSASHERTSAKMYSLALQTCYVDPLVVSPMGPPALIVDEIDGSIAGQINREEENSDAIDGLLRFLEVGSKGRAKPRRPVICISNENAAFKMQQVSTKATVVFLNALWGRDIREVCFRALRRHNSAIPPERTLKQLTESVGGDARQALMQLSFHIHGFGSATTMRADKELNLFIRTSQMLNCRVSKPALSIAGGEDSDRLLWMCFQNYMQPGMDMAEVGEMASDLLGDSDLLTKFPHRMYEECWCLWRSYVKTSRTCVTRKQVSYAHCKHGAWETQNKRRELKQKVELMRKGSDESALFRTGPPKRTRHQKRSAPWVSTPVLSRNTLIDYLLYAPTPPTAIPHAASTSQPSAAW